MVYGLTDGWQSMACVCYAWGCYSCGTQAEHCFEPYTWPFSWLVPHSTSQEKELDLVPRVFVCFNSVGLDVGFNMGCLSTHQDFLVIRINGISYTPF